MMFPQLGGNLMRDGRFRGTMSGGEALRVSDTALKIRISGLAKPCDRGSDLIERTWVSGLEG